MTVRMISVDHGGKRPVGNRGCEIPQLAEAVHSELSHALELVRLELRAADDIRQQSECLLAESRQRRQGQNGGIRSDFSVELRADATEGVVDLEGRTAPRALIEHVAGERGKT